jgi:hypothetical protein
MEEKDFQNILKLLDDMLHKLHLAALKGLAPHETIRGIATSLEIRFQEKELARAEKDIKEAEEMIEQHLVTKVEEKEQHIYRDILRAVKNIYLAIFNSMIQQKVEIMEMEEFVEKALKKIPAGEFKKELAAVILELIKDWKDDLRAIHNGANGVLANAKDRKSTALAITKLLHTQGPSYFKRKQEQKLMKDAHKKGEKAEKEGLTILRMQFKNKEEAKKRLEQYKKDEKQSIQEYMKAIKLLDTDWEQASKDFDKINTDIENAVAKHEVPSRDAEQVQQIVHKLLHVIEQYTHSLNEGVNQLDSIRKSIKGSAEKL